MTQAEAMAFASKHINLIGTKVKCYAGLDTLCTVLRFFVTDEGIDKYKVEVLLSPMDGVEMKADLKKLLETLRMN